MSACFSKCANLVSLENFPSGVTDMRACFYKCENLTTVPDIPAVVYDMTSCFQNCKKLQSIKMNCPYVVGNFDSAFSDCTDLPNGGIQVLWAHLTTYQTNAGSMGTSAEKFAGF